MKLLFANAFNLKKANFVFLLFSDTDKYISLQFKVEKGKMMKHQFVDEGEHWCKGCNIDFHNIHDFVQHLSSYKHKQVSVV